jgi:hypothetical protein
LREKKGGKSVKEVGFVQSASIKPTVKQRKENDMRIIYEDMSEFARCIVRCTDNVRKGKCQYCPFFDDCIIDDPEARSIMCGEIGE